MQRGLVEHMRWMWCLTEGFRLRLFLYVALEVTSICLGVVFVLWTKKVVDMAVMGSGAFFSNDLQIMLLSLLLSVVLRVFAGWLNDRTKVEMLLKTQRNLLSRQLRATWRFMNKWTSGDVQVRIQNDVQEVVLMAGYSIWSAIVTAISLITFFLVLAWFDIRLAVLMLMVSLMFGLAKVYFKKSKALNERLKKAQSEFGHVVQESIQYKLLIRALSIYAARWARVEDSIKKVGSLQKELINFTTFSHGLIRLLGAIGFLLAFCWGLYRLHLGLITFGSLTAFLQLVSRIQTPVLSLMAFVPFMIRSRVAADRVMDLMDVEVELEKEDIKIKKLKALHVKDVSFKYEDQLIIEGLSLSVAKGESVAIMGASGKGKTTFVRLLLGLLVPTEGDIFIECENGKKILKDQYRINMAYVPQGGKLFRGTVRQNLEVMGDKITLEEMDKAIYLGCAEFIYELPKGLDTEIGEEGYGLSEGQAQRIAIARAMLRDSPIWLLDELTSALDAKTAQMLMTRLLAAAEDKIILVITHDMEIAKRCGKIINV
ncbi:ABC transporter ATP-binding protein [Sphingobacterium sp. UT-1RO-CII-1]|uniref:ABC transporter ATP-binding protein n=1 Tax=Sphingobacterium sp. UT-1RO-CII-1 TaxID=2995225 RepID=UPI00227D639F|nr:ABC transporter ATP-binding protein [Sphingobacterium sp. UT-1RO-CII-1]MCY4778526.1 ABC transporter ATP-binding protein [Sphingobacterium sp. UT-1RO-CII-1]